MLVTYAPGFPMLAIFIPNRSQATRQARNNLAFAWLFLLAQEPKIIKKAF
jgi:hypothetical protein